MNGLLTRGRVIYLHMRRPHWFVVAAGLLVAVLLFMAAPTANGSLLACGLAGTVLLWCYGAVLAMATLTTAGTGLALAPGAQRAVWRAASAIGLIAIVMVSVAIFVVAWLAAEPGSGLLWLAAASLALASGFALMVAANSRHGRTLFWAIALLPLTAWPLTRTGESPGPWLLALWALAWPACVAHSARVMTSMVQGRPPAPHKPTPAAGLLAIDSLSERWLRRGLNEHPADTRCLMREPWQQRDGAILLMLAWTTAVLGWNGDYSSQTFLLQCYMLFITTVLLPIRMLEAGFRPRLLLLPGGVARPNLAWTLFCEGLRSWSRAAGIILVVAAIGISMSGRDAALRGASVGLILAGQIILNFCCSIALQARIATSGWRLIQMLVGLAMMIACIVVLPGAIVTRPATWSMLWIALALGLLQTLIGILLVRTSAQAWSRFDWIRFRSVRRL